MLGKMLLIWANLLTPLTLNIAFGIYVFTLGWYRQLSACYLILAYTRAQPAESVNSEKPKPTDGLWEQVFRSELNRGEKKDGNHDKGSNMNAGLFKGLFRKRPFTVDIWKRSAMENSCWWWCVIESGQDDLVMSVRLSHHKELIPSPGRQ